MPKKKNSPHYGKGDWKRPVDEKKFAENYDRIFGKKQTAGDVDEIQTTTGVNTTPTK